MITFKISKKVTKLIGQEDKDNVAGRSAADLEGG